MANSASYQGMSALTCGTHAYGAASKYLELSVVFEISLRGMVPGFAASRLTVAMIEKTSSAPRPAPRDRAKQRKQTTVAPAAQSTEPVMRLSRAGAVSGNVCMATRMLSE